MEHWLAKQEMQLTQSSSISDEREATKVFRKFLQEIALLLLSKRKIEIKVKHDEIWRKYFVDRNPQAVKARNGCPIRRQKGNEYSFIHKSFLEFFAAKGILFIIANKAALLPEEIEIFPDMITQDQGVFSFLRDAFALYPELKQKCFSRIQESRLNSSKTIGDPKYHTVMSAAANAITLLNVISYDFSNLDLKNICVPKANLSHGTFEHTDFTNSNLKSVNFASAWLKDANFKGANLSGVNFGEWPYLQFEEPICCISFSADGKMMAAAMGSNTIIFTRDDNTRDIREQKRIQDKDGNFVNYCKLNADGKQAIICSKDKFPCVYDTATGDCLLELKEGFGYEATTVDFSSDGKQVVFSREDYTLCIWNFTTGSLTHEFRGHLDKITTCKFSPDGTQIVSASQDKTLRVWDVVNSMPVQQISKPDFSKKSLNLAEVNIEDAVELSDTNLMLLYQKGACGFSEKHREVFIEKLNKLLGNQRKDCDKLDLSQKSINNEGAWGIEKFMIWLDLKEVNLSQNYIGNKGAIGLGSNERWINLIRLNLSSNLIEEEGAQGLANNTSWYNLEELDLRKNKIGDDGAKALSKNTSWKRLQNIYLDYNNLSKVSYVMQSINKKYAEQLIDTNTDNLAELQTIDFLEKAISEMHQEFRSEVEQWKDERREDFINTLKKRETFKLDWEDLCREGFTSADDPPTFDLMWMPHIKLLDLNAKKVGIASFTSLAKNLTLIDLEELVLPENELGNEYLSIIANNLTWKNLKRISLVNNNIDDDGIANFINNLRSKDLSEINLSKNKIGDAGIKAVGSSEALRNLKRLLLHENNISNDGMIDLIENSTLEKIEVLNLSNNGIDDEDGLVIGGNKSRKTFIELNESDNNGGNEMATTAHLKAFHLQNNRIGDGGAENLSKNTAWTQLKALDLSYKNIRAMGVEYLSKNTSWAQLQTLDLSFNIVDEKGAEYLSKNTTWSNLQTLNLRRNDIGDKGAEYLSKNITWLHLQTLDLSDNNIGDKGAECLSKNTSWTYLHTLDLRMNHIGEQGAEYLRNNKYWTSSLKLKLKWNSTRPRSVGHLSKKIISDEQNILDRYLKDTGNRKDEYLNKHPTSNDTFNLHRNNINRVGIELLNKKITKMTLNP